MKQQTLQEFIVYKLSEPWEQLEDRPDKLKTSLTVKFEALVNAQSLEGYRLASWQYTTLDSNHDECVVAVFELSSDERMRIEKEEKGEPS